MHDSEFIDICAVKGCISHLDKRRAKPHPDIDKGLLCPNHEFMYVKPVEVIAPGTAAYYQMLADKKEPEPEVIHTIPDRTYKASTWAAPQLDSLSKALVFEQAFTEIFGEG